MCSTSCTRLTAGDSPSEWQGQGQRQGHGQRQWWSWWWGRGGVVDTRESCYFCNMLQHLHCANITTLQHGMPTC